MNEAEDESLIDAILASGVKIPSMPTALLNVLALERNDEAGPREYADVIGRDPGMSGAIFRVVGSPVMGLRTRIDSLENAITLLGLRTTLAVVRSEGMHSALHDPEQANVMNILWVRSNAIADLILATVRLIRLRGIREDLAFQAGIFHDCGIALLCRRDPAYAKAFHEAKHWPDLMALDVAHNTSHAVVGMMVARNWQLPQDVAETIRHHHEPHPELLPELVRALCALVQFAAHLLNVRMGSDDGEWEGVWKPHVEALFRHAGHELAEVEEELLSRPL